MPTNAALSAHRNWWRGIRPQRMASLDYVPLIIRHGAGGDMSEMPYTVRLHAPMDVVSQAFAGLGTVSKAVSDGRWITVHPNGADQPGHPVMIKDNPDGSATIVGGIGGKLNGFRLSLVRSDDDYKAELAGRAKRERERLQQEKQRLIEQDGLEEYQRQQQLISDDREARKRKKIAAAESLARTVLQAQGIDPDAVLEVPSEVLASAKNAQQRDRIREAHVLGVAKHAKAIADDVRQRVVTAIEAQQPVEGVGFADVVREALSGKSAGYSVNPDRIAVERGIKPSADAMQRIREDSFLLRAEGDEGLAAQRMANTAKLQAGAAVAREAIKTALERSALHGSGPHAIAGMAAQPVGIENAGAILAAAKAYREASRSKPSSGNRPVSPVAFHPDIEGEDIPAQSIVDELRTRAVSKIVDMSNAEEAVGNSLYGHISRSRYSQLSSMAGEMLPGATVDPALVDFLGTEASAQMLGRAIAETHGLDRLNAYKERLTSVHLEQQVPLCQKAANDASALLDRAGQPLQLDADNSDSIIAAFGSAKERQQLVADAQQRLGEARGRIEATASAIKAFDTVVNNPDAPIRAIIPGTYDKVATMASVMMPGLKLGDDYDIVSPQSGMMAVDIKPSGIARLLTSSELLPNSDVAHRLNVIQQSKRTTGRLPDGLRREVDAMAPAHGVAVTEYADLTSSDRAVIRNYWAASNGFNAADECDPYGNLRPEQEPVWRRYQQALGEGAERELLQTGLEGRFDAFAGLDLDDDRAVVDFGRTYSDVLGLDVVRGGDGGTVSIPALDGRKTEAGKARFLRPRIMKLARTLWANTQGADYFDPAAIKPVSDAWSKFVARSGGDMTAVAAVQDQMKADPEVMAMQGKPLHLTQGQERMVNMIVGNRRMAAGLGAGAGKTLVMMGSFAQLKNDGSANRALIAVPSAVVGQFESEWNKFVEPRSGMTMHAATGDTRKTDEAMSGGADFVVMTHEGLRKKLLDACAREMQATPDEASRVLLNSSASHVDKIVHSAMRSNNWNFDYFAYDEGHKTLGRAGKADSLLSTLLDSAARLPTDDNKLPYYVFATADPAKNDVSELHSLLGKIDPDRFPVETRDQFVRAYGRNTQDCAIALRNMMSPYIYTQPAEVPVKQTRGDILLPLTEHEQNIHDAIQAAYQQARLGRSMGQPNIGAEKTLGATNPKALALARDNAISRVLLWSDKSSKAQWVGQKIDENRGRSAVIFARNRASVDALKRMLSDRGHKVETLTGSDSGLSKRRKREAFQNKDHDILICTDAAEAGMNLQRGNLMINFDVPMTAKTLEQRIARQVRMGQTSDVDVFNLVSDCKWDRRNLERLKGKGTLREIITSPFELADDTGKTEERIRTEAGV